MMDNPYYQLIRLIRSQSGGGGQQAFFTAVLTQAEPAVFLAGEAPFSPAMTAAGLTLSPQDVGGTYLCLSLDSQTAVLCRLTPQ